MTKAYYSIEKNGKVIANVTTKKEAVKIAMKKAGSLFWITENGKIGLNRKGEMIHMN